MSANELLFGLNLQQKKSIIAYINQVVIPDVIAIVSDPDNLPEATTSQFGTVKKAAAQSDFAGVDLAALKVELNTFLTKLEAAGIVAT